MTYIPELTNGAEIVGRAVTATLYVSPDGDNSNGTSWIKAYTTIQAALDAASTDANDVTLILVGPHATYYDIGTSDDPTWTGNYEIVGPHRLWAPVRNTELDATSIMKFTGKVSISDMAFFSDDENNADGVIFTKSGFRIRRCGFNSADTDGANTSIHIDGSAALIRGGIIEDVQIVGHQTHTTGLYIDTGTINEFKDINFHDCLNGIQIINAASDTNFFRDIVFGDCTIALNLDAGNDQHFHDLTFHGCTTNVDDEVHNHVFNGISGELPIYVAPTGAAGGIVGTSINIGEDEWEADTELIPVSGGIAPAKPFKVLGYILAPTTDKTIRIRFSADSGSTYFAEYVGAATKKNKASGAGDATDFIFNVGTRISASGYGGEAAKTSEIWLEIQEI